MTDPIVFLCDPQTNRAELPYLIPAVTSIGKIFNREFFGHQFSSKDRFFPDKTTPDPVIIVRTLFSYFFNLTNLF